MVEVIERETVNEAIEATVNYIENNGEKLFTETAGPGGTDVRTGGTVDPHRVTIHNARLRTEASARLSKRLGSNWSARRIVAAVVVAPGDATIAVMVSVVVAPEASESIVQVPEAES